MYLRMRLKKLALHNMGNSMRLSRRGSVRLSVSGHPTKTPSYPESILNEHSLDSLASPFPTSSIAYVHRNTIPKMFSYWSSVYIPLSSFSLV